MQAITTKYIGPSNVRGSRVKATSGWPHSKISVTLDWDNGMHRDDNHKAAAMALAEKYERVGTWHGGHSPDGGMVFVQVDPFDNSRLTFTRKES